MFVVPFVLGTCVASLANAATYEWAWNRRRLSPWQPTPEGVGRRSWLDCLPVVGWLRLRRDASVLGSGFWIRPMLVELSFGLAMAALFFWEVILVQLAVPQMEQGHVIASLTGPENFVFHFVLATLMLVATLIDIDEKTIPDQITVPGTLIGLLLATLLPMGLLPNVEERAFRPEVGMLIKPIREAPLVGPGGNPIYLEPTHINAPNEWPTALAGGPNNHSSLMLGLGCFFFWCFALTPRFWRTRRGAVFGLGVLLRRVGRELNRRPLREILLLGVLWTTCVWYTGGAAWQGLLTSLAGMIVSGSIVWAVRIVGSVALGREAMGFGDVTLMMMIGAFLGWQAGLMIFFLAPFAALLIGISQVVLRRDDEIPYGPFLCLAAAFVVVQWGTIWPRSEHLFAMGTVLPVVLIVCLVLLGVMLAIWRQFKLRVLGMSEDWDEQPT